MSDSAATNPGSSANSASASQASANSAPMNTQAQAQGTAPNTNVNEAVNTQLATDNMQQNDIGDAYNMEQANANTVPENYNFTINDQVVDSEAAKEFSDVCRGLKLNQEQAQQALNFLMSEYNDWQSDAANKAQETMAATKKEWQSEIMNDSELGGQNFNQTKLNIKNAMAKYGSKELAEFFNESGLGYNPHFVRFMNKLGASIANDNSFIGGNSAPTQTESSEMVARRRYPKSPELWH